LFGVQLADRRPSEQRLDLRDSLIEALMQRAQSTSMLGEPQWTAFDSLQGIDSIDDIQDGQFVQRPGKDETAVQASLRLNKTCPAQCLEDLG
jgi:hypothetical protein